MHGPHFDAWTRRRFGQAVGGLATALLGLTTAEFSGTTRTKKGKQSLQRNTFGCVNVGGKCRGKDKHCCSGVCQGKKPKKGEKDTSRCVAHDTGGCTAADSQCGMQQSCTTSTGRAGGCVTTTGNASYCADWVTTFPCTKDADCRPYCGPLAACYVNTCFGGASGCAGPGECDFP